MRTYTIPAPEDESVTTVFTNEVWVNHGKPEIPLLEEGWTNIGPEAFLDAKELLGIRIPASVVSIEANAFMNATNLHQVAFVEDSKLKSIGDNAFSGATSLVNINIPVGVTDIGSGAFANTQYLKNKESEQSGLPAGGKKGTIKRGTRRMSRTMKARRTMKRK